VATDDRAAQVDPDDAVQVVLLAVEERPDHIDAGVVHENVDRSEPTLDVGDRSGDVPSVRDVDVQGHGGDPAIAANALGELLGQFAVHVPDGDGGAGGRQLGGDCFTNPASCPCDYCDTIGQISTHGVLPPV